MCSGAIYWCGIGRVVYALSEERLLHLTGDHPENPTFSLPCREVFARGQHRVEVEGPALAWAVWALRLPALGPLRPAGLAGAWEPQSWVGPPTPAGPAG